MNNIEILEKLKDEQYTKETLFTICKFYDEEFKPYVLSTEERDALENLIKENTELRIQISARETVVNELEKENKELKKYEIYYKEMEEVNKKFIPKSKLKEIIYPTPENYIPLEVQQSDMYKKLESLLED